MKQSNKNDSNQFLSMTILLDQLLENFTIVSSLKTENDTLRSIIELLPGMVYWKNLQGKFLGCNKNVANIAGLQSPQDIINKDVRELFGEAYATTTLRNDEEVIATGKEHNYEEIGLTLNHQTAVYLSKKLPLYNSMGEIVGTMGVSLDISERKKMEEELKLAKEKAEISNRAKSQFVAAVNHELRTPLASIIGLVDLLKDETLDLQESKKMIASIENSAQHLLNLVNDVLDFSKLETGKQHLQITPVNFSALSSEVYDLLKPLAKNKDLIFSLSIDSNLPTFLLSDARVLRHILINFVSNAIKFTHQGKILTEIKTLNKTKEKVQLKISITDTGIGIPADKLSLIFKPFQQLNNSNIRSSSRNGTGLGLTIVKKLAEAIEGTLEVESQLGHGSVFSLIAEFTIPNEKVIGINQKFLPDFQSNTGNKSRVLVVEDDAIIQYIHKKLLTNLGCEVDVVSNATEALKVLRNNHDIIFLDMSLPDFTGCELIKKIRQTTSFNCPIVIISAYLNREEEIACLQAGANAFVSKPISQEKFKELLRLHCCVLEKV